MGKMRRIRLESPDYKGGGIEMSCSKKNRAVHVYSPMTGYYVAAFELSELPRLRDWCNAAIAERKEK